MHQKGGNSETDGDDDGNSRTDNFNRRGMCDPTGYFIFELRQRELHRLFIVPIVDSRRPQCRLRFSATDRVASISGVPWQNAVQI